MANYSNSRNPLLDSLQSFDYELCTISYVLSTINYVLSTINYQL